jgi:hypothetical protein
MFVFLFFEFGLVVFLPAGGERRKQFQLFPAEFNPPTRKPRRRSFDTSADSPLQKCKKFWFLSYSVPSLFFTCFSHGSLAHFF